MRAGAVELVDALSASRLNATAAPLPASFNLIDPNYGNKIPQVTAPGGNDPRILTSNRISGIPNQIHKYCNPRPGTLPAPVTSSSPSSTNQ